MDIQNNNVTIQINAKDLSGKPLRVHECDIFIVHVYTDDPKRYLSFSKRDMLVTEFVDELTVPRHQMERLNSGVVQYTYDYLPINHECKYENVNEEIGDDCNNPFHLHHHHHIHENLIHSKPVVTSIYWRNVHHPHPNFPVNSVTLFDIERLQREIDAERISREKDIQDLQGQFGEGFSDKLDAEIERSKAEDERINAALTAIGVSLGELGGNVGDNQEENRTDIEQNKIDIASETARAIAKETQLQQAIDGEISRAKSQEEVISTTLQMEKERATANEANINDRLVSLTDRFDSFKELNSETLKSEIERAKATESALNDKIQGVVKDLATEVSRAAEKDIEHTNLVNTESNRAQAVENRLEENLTTEINRAKDAEKHLLDEVHGVQEVVSNLATATNVYSKSEVDNKVNDVKNDLSTLENTVNNHLTTANELTEKVSSLSSDVDKAKADLLAEIAKCDAENNKLSTDIQTLSDSTYTKAEVDTKVNDLNSSISSLENWKNNHVDNTEGLTDKVTKLVSDVEKLNTDLSNETTARINADLTLQTKVDVAEGKVDAEVERAKAQEKLISDELKDVKDNATSKHSELSDSIGEVSANLTLEIAERKAQDKVLSDALEIVNGDVETNGSIKKSLADSKAYTDAEIAKLSLQKDSEIADTLKSYATNESVDKKISDVIGTAPEALDTLGKLSNALSQDSDAITAINGVLEGKANSEDVYTKSEIDSQVTAINNALSTETTARENADSTINGRIDDLVAKVNGIETNVDSNNSTLSDAITAEETARKAQDKAISDKLDSEVDKLNTKYSELNAKVIQDIADSSAKDVELEASISATNTLLANVESKIDNEVLRATEKDNELVAKDTALEAKIDANTLAIQNEVNRSKQVQKELNDKINGLDLDGANTSISALNDKVDSEISAREASDKVHSDAIAVLQTSVTSLTDSVNAQSAKDIEIDAKIDNVQSTLQTAIENEAKTARASEKANEDAIKALSEKVDAIEIPTVDFTEVNSAISTLETKVDNEVSRAKNAEKINSDNIASLQSSVSSISETVSNLNTKDVELQTAINAEKARIDVINGDKETVGSIAHSVEEAKHYVDESLEGYQPKGDYLTQHQSLEDYYNKEQVDIEIAKVNSAIETHKNEADSKYLTQHQSLEDYYTKSQVDNAILGVENKMPSKVSELTNDSGYQTESEVKAIASAKVAEVVNGAPEAFDTLKEIADALKNNDDAVSGIVATLADKANSSDVYSKNEVDSKETALNNTISTLETKVDNEVSKLNTAIEAHANLADSKYLKEHQDISHLATKASVESEISALETKIGKKANSDDVYSKNEVDNAIANVDVTEQLKDYATKEEVESAIADVDVTEQLKDYVKAEDNTVFRDSEGNIITSLIIDFDEDGEDIPVYNKNEVDYKFATKQELHDAIEAIEKGDVDLSDYYNKAEVDAKIPSLVGYATKAEVDALGDEIVNVSDAVALKANSDDVYDKTYIDGIVTSVNSSLNSKLPIDSFNEWSNTVATKEYVDGKVDAVESYDDTALKARIDALESKEDSDTVFDDTEINNRLDALEAKEIPSLDDVESDIATINSTLANKADKSEIPDVSNFATKAEIPSLDNVYSKEEVNDLIANVEVDLSDYATHEDVSSKADSDNVYSKEEADARFAQFWSGTQAEYDAISEKKSNIIYIITE